ncbi:histone deacetylase [Methanolobus sp. ZRKC2]|uniref:histone deacetylase family protein n=1 Tax=Methanolobus sp. ZRKC2 TaxID=3125783 RepID=UPI00324C7613
MVHIGLTFNENHKLHDPLLNGFPSPESPQRLDRIFSYLSQNGILDNGICSLFKSDPALIEDISRVHTRGYIDLVQSSIRQSVRHLGNDTYLCDSSFEVLLQALGCVIHAGVLVARGTCDHSFALIRPPGHHAGISNSSGFCLFNNSAILARYLQEKLSLKRIAILNIDAHASDGTYSIFSGDPNVLCISVHQDPSTLYPYTCFIKDIGVYPALGFSINMEMPPRSGNAEYAIFFDEIVEKVLKKFDPEIVLLECGFDSYFKESLAQLDLTVDGYYNIVSRLASKWNVVCLLEGGYHEDLGLLASVVIEGLMGKKTIADEVDQVDLLASRHMGTRKIFVEKLSKLKMVLNPYWESDIIL